MYNIFNILLFAYINFLFYLCALILILTKMDKIKNVIGGVAEGKDFFGRTKELERAIELLEDGNNLILAAPRRVGKTSFARKI